MLTTEKISDYEWYWQNKEELLKNYKNKLIAIWENQVIAYGDDGGKVLDECILKYPDCEPLIEYVDEAERFGILYGF